MKRLGLIAGAGELPGAVAQGARQGGYSVHCVALDPPADESLKGLVDEFRLVDLGKFGQVLKTLKGWGVTEAVLAGKVPKTLLYKENIGKLVPDLKTARILLSLKNRKDDTIMLALTRELGKAGITLLEITGFCSSLLAPPGPLTKGKPSRSEMKDIEFGFAMAKELGRLDIGQTVVVKDQAVMAVEAIEGTDEAIKRGGALAREGAVVVKAGKPMQDMRFDVPAVGLDTLRAMVSVKAKVLAIEANKTLVLKKQELIKGAARAGIKIFGFSA